MLGVEGSDETLSCVIIRDHVSGLDDISGVATEHLDEVFRLARFRCCNEGCYGVPG